MLPLNAYTTYAMTYCSKMPQHLLLCLGFEHYVSANAGLMPDDKAKCFHNSFIFNQSQLVGERPCVCGVYL